MDPNFKNEAYLGVWYCVSEHNLVQVEGTVWSFFVLLFFFLVQLKKKTPKL